MCCEIQWSLEWWISTIVAPCLWNKIEVQIRDVVLPAHLGYCLLLKVTAEAALSELLQSSFIFRREIFKSEALIRAAVVVGIHLNLRVDHGITAEIPFEHAFA